MPEVLRYETHGHSTATDGNETPEQIVLAAVGLVDILTLSDHNTLKGIPRFLEAIKRVNDRGVRLYGVAATEVSAQEGHMTIAVPELDRVPQFIKWVERLKEQGKFVHTKASGLIVPAVRELGATVTFTHPTALFCEGFSLESLDRTLNELPADVVSHLAVEVDNNSVSAIPGAYQLYRRNIKAWNKKAGLAPVAGSDYHTAKLIGRKFSLVPTYDGKIDILRSIKERTIRPSGRPQTSEGFFNTWLYHGLAYSRYKLGFHKHFST